MQTPCVIVWFRQDLRLDDHPALNAAVEAGQPIVPIYIDSSHEESTWRPGGASKWWLHHALADLDRSLRHVGSRLIVRRGPALPTLEKLIAETGANTVLWSRRYESAVTQRDSRIKQTLRVVGVEVRSFNSALLFEPWDIRTGQGEPYKVFTPFWRTCCQMPEPDGPIVAPKKLNAPQKWPASLTLDELRLLPTIAWDGGFKAIWNATEAGATKALTTFIRERAEGYASQRDKPGVEGTSTLSPYLHFGQISPRRIWRELKAASPTARIAGLSHGSATFLKEVGWREFAYHLLHHFPHTTDRPMRAEYEKFPWRHDPAALKQWQQGRTGYPIVDAGMRQLWRTGWMHNRVRMIVASFLVKDLLIPWRDGAAWFWDTLVDADLASNTLGWQWTAGCGADAAPYFRIFNPVSQGKRFDPAGAYVRRWVPELGKLDAEVIHEPWEAGAMELAAAGVVLGETYPGPMFDHHEARRRALAALASISKK